MPKYKVHICRIAYSHLDIEVEADSHSEASKNALEEAGNRSFPTEKSFEYTVEGVIQL